jgi:hypothetical protein
MLEGSRSATDIALHQTGYSGTRPVGGGLRTAWIARQKKAQPVEVALKVPPKEEVLEECAATCAAATHLNNARTPALMQAFAIAMHHIVDFKQTINISMAYHAAPALA